MLRKSKHKCYEIKMQRKSLEGEMKKQKNGKSTQMEKLKKEILPNDQKKRKKEISVI